MKTLGSGFFDKPSRKLAIDLLGKVLRHNIQYQGRSVWLSARIIETEAYEITEKGSHPSLGFTPKRAALIMAPGTIYMYYSRGKDSINFSARGKGHGVLVKSAFPHIDRVSPKICVEITQKLNPSPSGVRTPESLCKGQTLMCKALDLKLTEWDQMCLDEDNFVLTDAGLKVPHIIQCPRLGIPIGRDEHLMYRFVDYSLAKHCTSNPLTKRRWRIDKDYKVLEMA
ncbi:MAG TPA: DNA-3-methyladenine glycosylase [Gammaproteobacteria bacterium]|nr:DNA-3-methyladenine glycosylase [Gammaproteobacteria bacterium]